MSQVMRYASPGFVLTASPSHPSAPRGNCLAARRSSLRCNQTTWSTAAPAVLCLAVAHARREGLPAGRAAQRLRQVYCRAQGQAVLEAGALDDGWDDDDDAGASENVPLSKKAPLLIDGKIIIPPKSFKVSSPATGDLVGMAPNASKAQISAAVEAASRAAEAWGSMPHTERAAILESCAALLRSKLEPLAILQTNESGRPIPETRLELIVAAASFENAARLLNIEQEKVISVDEEKKVVVRRSPIGVTAIIAPWNAPIVLGWKPTATALACGNTVVLKPAPQTPLTTLRIGELLRPLLPRGVLNVVVASDKTDPRPGEILTAHPLVRKVVFTGSTAIGSKVMAACAKDFKRVLLELGGNDPAIVREDTDIEMAAAGLFKGAFFNNGQTCCAAKRIYVQESIFDAFVEAFVARARRAVLGNGLTEGVELGPLANNVQLRHVTELVEDARQNGGRVLCGGGAIAGPPGDESSNTGLFYLPTIVVGISEGTRLVDEEQFGPVVPVMPYKDDEEAIRRANNTRYGLGASIWSADYEKANAIANKLKAGTVWVNRHCEFIRNAPFGGIDTSGIGRAGDLGQQDFSEYTEIRTLCLAKLPEKPPPELASLQATPCVDVEERAQQALQQLFSRIRAGASSNLEAFEADAKEAMRTFPFQPLNFRSALESLAEPLGPACVLVKGLLDGKTRSHADSEADKPDIAREASLIGMLGLLDAGTFSYCGQEIVHAVLQDSDESFGWHREGRWSPAYEPPRRLHRPEAKVPDFLATVCQGGAVAGRFVDFRKLRASLSPEDLRTLHREPLAFFDAELGIRSERLLTARTEESSGDVIFELRDPNRFEAEGSDEAVAAYQRLCQAADDVHEAFQLESGAMAVFNNKRCAHLWERPEAGSGASVKIACGSRGAKQWQERVVK
eukprot:TRINITY_DN33619_c0_g1_i1.p1 TRINITY_DN33619_c0_g1~~TRINITY_DN33619_c0_g1_i1.p1  ORF type:complete len:908 (+),score=192.99 TRINITY_DN33619_c0_g1_i1:33-2756(+)